MRKPMGTYCLKCGFCTVDLTVKDRERGKRCYHCGETKNIKKVFEVDIYEKQNDKVFGDKQKVALIAKTDNVENPKGYQLASGKELKNIYPDLMGLDATVSFYLGNVIKYMTRFRSKNGHEDLMKAMQYIQMIDELVYAGSI